MTLTELRKHYSIRSPTAGIAVARVSGWPTRNRPG